MNALLPSLARTAGYAALTGVGLELVIGSREKTKGMIFVSLVVGTVAFHALAFYAGVGIAIGAPIGALMGGKNAWDHKKSYVDGFMGAVGGAILGGMVGYFGSELFEALGEVSKNMRWVFVRRVY